MLYQPAVNSLSKVRPTCQHLAGVKTGGLKSILTDFKIYTKFMKNNISITVNMSNFVKYNHIGCCYVGHRETAKSSTKRPSDPITRGHLRCMWRHAVMPVLNRVIWMESQRHLNTSFKLGLVFLITPQRVWIFRFLTIVLLSHLTTCLYTYQAFNLLGTAN